MAADHATVWIFAYGSLLWRPGFAHRERRVARLTGWSRRLWQGSPDHRGIPAAPGRVVTLVPDPEAICVGLAYALDAAAAPPVLAALDVREQGGYDRRPLRVALDACAPSHDAATAVDAVTWIADPGNAHYLGPASLGVIAAQVRAAHGPSGANADYVRALAAALRELGVVDPHVEGVAALLEEDAPAEA